MRFDYTLLVIALGVIVFAPVYFSCDGKCKELTRSFLCGGRLWLWKLVCLGIYSHRWFLALLILGAIWDGLKSAFKIDDKFLFPIFGLVLGLALPPIFARLFSRTIMGDAMFAALSETISESTPGFDQLSSSKDALNEGGAARKNALQAIRSAYSVRC